MSEESIEKIINRELHSYDKATSLDFVTFCEITN